jgi:magnesium transporter
MLRQLRIKWITWIDAVNLLADEIEDVLESFNFHELDVEAVMEPNQRARIDSYDNYMFLTLHFPKYNAKQKMYELNEFHIFLGKNFLITLRDFPGKHIDDIYEKYEKKWDDDEYDIDVSSGLILYELIQEMLEKMFRVALNVKRDISALEKQVFQKSSAPLVRNILIKKRNIIVLKHMFQPQMSVLIWLENHMKRLFNNEIEAYFEDLEDKLQKIITDILVLEEQVESVEDAFKSMIDIQTNSIIKFLTIFSAFMLPLTLITSFYGMNISLPYQDTPYIAYASMCISVAVLGVAFLFFQKKRKI